jgi:dihydroxy-acid dehydratase
VRLLAEGITARRIINEQSMANAIKTDIAIAGSTNLLLHLPAIGQEAGMNKDWWRLFDEASREIPLLAAIYPSGPYYMKDFDEAGGMRALLKNLLPRLDGSALTVNGKTLAENAAAAQVYKKEVIHDLAHPVATDGGVVVLYGNLAPEGAILKAAAVSQSMQEFRGPAKVFDTLDSAFPVLRSGGIKAGDAVVIRYLGPKGRFGTTAFTFQKELAGMSIGDAVAVITDGRFSGGTGGLSVGYISPGAAEEGPLALVEYGDIVEISISKRVLNLDVPPAVLEERRKAWHGEFPAEQYHKFLNMFVRNATSSAKGVVWKQPDIGVMANGKHI